MLITGSSGFIGSFVTAGFRGSHDWHVVTDHDKAGKRPDLAAVGAWNDFIKEVKPDLVVHMAAMSSIAQCDAAPDLAAAVNTRAVSEIADACAESDALLIHFSTDQVFDGRSAPYDEDDAARPLHHYGRTKRDAEKLLTDHHCRSIVLRPTLVYGLAPNHPNTAAECLRLAATEGRTLRLFTDEYRTPVHVGDVVRAVLGLATRPAEGIFHVAGPERLSRFAFGQAVCEAWGLSSACMAPTTLDQAGFAGRRPPDLALDVTRISLHMPWNPLSPAQGLALHHPPGHDQDRE